MVGFIFEMFFLSCWMCFLVISCCLIGLGLYKYFCIVLGVILWGFWFICGFINLEVNYFCGLSEGFWGLCYCWRWEVGELLLFSFIVICVNKVVKCWYFLVLVLYEYWVVILMFFFLELLNIIFSLCGVLVFFMEW